MSKQQRHERKKTERVRRHRAIRNGATALAAAATIAAGTSAYAAPVRHDNPPGAGHFDWWAEPGNPGYGVGFLDVTLDAASQLPDVTGVPSEFGHDAEGSTSGAGQVWAHAGADSLQVVHLAGYPFVAGVDGGDLIPSGLPWSHNGYVYYPGLGGGTPEGAPSYLGVRFDLGGGNQYGWIGVVRSGIALDAFAWGYETEAGVPIPAGAPEPGSLALLALGAAGLAAGRRRRRA